MAEQLLRIEHHLTIDSETGSVADVLAQQTGLSKQRIKQAMIKGAVWLTRGRTTQRIRRATRVLRRGDTLHLYYDEQVLARNPPVPCLIADEGDYSIWYKPCGMLSQGSKWGDHCTINRWAEQHLAPQRPAFVVHRLDRAATGLIIIAHKKQTAAALSKLFQARQMEKRYRVIVHGRVTGPAQTIDAEIDGRAARSHVSCLDYDASTNRSLLAVDIETGRKHQIRRHLAAQGFPVVGDRLYGDKRDEEDLQLSACRLAFTCPVSRQLKTFILPEKLLPMWPPR